MDSDQVVILIHENVLHEMKARRNRLLRQMHTLHQDINDLEYDIQRKEQSLDQARQSFLLRTT